MPGANCSIRNCGASRRTKGIGIFRLPHEKPSDEAHQAWRDAWLHAVLTTRVKDEGFAELIDKGNVYACEKHFRPHEIEICMFYLCFSL